MPRLSVRRLLTIFLVTVAVLPLALFAAAFWSTLRSHLDAEVGETTQAALRAVSIQTSARVIEEPRRVLPAILMLAESASGERGLREILRATSTTRPEFLWLAFLDEKGRIEASYPEGRGEVGEHYTTWAPIKGGDVSFSTAFIPSPGSGTVIEANYASAKRRAVAHIDLAGASIKLVLVALSPLDRIGVVDGAGKYILCSDPSRVLQGESVPRSLVTKSLVVVAPVSVSDEGGEFYASSASVPGSDWKAVYFRARSVVDAPMRAFLLRVAALGLGALLMAALMAYFAWRSVSTPLSALVSRIELVAQGSYGSRVAERVSGEFALEFREIADSFNAMAESIERRDREIQGSEARYRLLFNGNHAPALLIDVEGGRIRDANPAALAYFGRGELARSLSISELDADSSSDCPSSLLERMREAASGEGGLPARLLIGTGAVRDVELYVGAIEFEGRSFLHAIVVDVTDRRIAEERTIAALEEKTLLLREIHHRVKNNLQIISSLLSMQSDASGDARSMMVLRSGQDRVQAMALAHELVYQVDDLASIDLAEYVERLVVNLADAYGAKRASVRLELESIKLELDRAIPLGLAVNELVSNAFKYAMPDEAGISVLLHSAQEGEDATVVFAVEDSGPGMPARREAAAKGASRGTVAGGPSAAAKGSLGMVLVGALMDQLLGSVFWAAAEGGRGTRAELRFPLRRPSARAEPKAPKNGGCEP